MKFQIRHNSTGCIKRYEYLEPAQSLTYFCHLSIEPNYHYSLNQNKSELPTLMDEYLTTGKASPRSRERRYNARTK